MGTKNKPMGCGNSAQPEEGSAPRGEKCWVASPDIYKDVTPAEGPPPGEGLTYLNGCKLVEMKLAAGAKDKPCYHDKHYVFIVKGGKIKITGGPAGPGKTVEMDLATGSGAVMPAGEYEKENVGDGDLEVLILEVGPNQETTPENHKSCLEVEPTHYKCVAEDEDWMVITMDMDPGEEDKPHSHKEHVVYILSEGELSIWGGDKKTDPEKPDVGPVPVKPGVVLPVPTGYHIVKNSGDSIHVSAMFFERK